MRYARIWTDADGASHFEDVDVEMTPGQYAPPAPPFDVSTPLAAERAMFCSIQPGWHGDWHPTPRRQFYLQLSGRLEVEVSDGEIRRLDPGHVVLTEDLDGAGHATRVVGDVPSVGAFVHLLDVA